MTNYALLFPGQGSQYVGMGKSFYADSLGARFFEEAEEILSIPLKKLMFEGPLDELTDTAVAQPAILLHSVLAYFFFKREFGEKITCALGHSLGEYSALVALGVLPFKDALKIVHFRGQLMKEAVSKENSKMAAIMGLDADIICSAIEEFNDETKADYVAVANFNGPLQTVIAGKSLGIEKALTKLKSLGAKRVIELNVSAPFHCALMKPVQKKMAQILTNVNFLDATFPIISNVSAHGEKSGKKIRDLLVEQIASPTRFTDCVSFIKGNSLNKNGFLELGPKDTLCGLVKKIDKGDMAISIDDVSDFTKLRI